MFSNEQHRVFERYRDDYTKLALKQMQKVYKAFNPDHTDHCMCTKLARKIYYKKFTEWYDQNRDR